MTSSGKSDFKMMNLGYFCKMLHVNKVSNNPKVHHQFVLFLSEVLCM